MCNFCFDSFLRLLSYFLVQILIFLLNKQLKGIVQQKSMESDNPGYSRFILNLDKIVHFIIYQQNLLHSQNAKINNSWTFIKYIFLALSQMNFFSYYLNLINGNSLIFFCLSDILISMSTYYFGQNKRTDHTSVVKDQRHLTFIRKQFCRTKDL